MIVKHSVTTLNMLSKKNAIYCFGCGKRLHEMLELYKNEPFIKSITTLIDSNTKLHGQKILVGSCHIEISSAQILQTADMTNVFILITAERKEEIYRTIIENVKNKQVYCGEYPTCYFGYPEILLRLFCIFPLQRRIIFNAGVQPHENADAIVDYLNEEYDGKKFGLVYITDEGENQKKKNVKRLDRNLIRTKHSFADILKYCFLYATSKYILYENEPLFKVRKGQKSIYLNHGTIPLKRVDDVLKQPDEVDYGTCPAEGCAEIYEKQYGIPINRQLYIMPPRLRRLFSEENHVHKVVEYAEEQIIIWLPTFRVLEGTNRKDSNSDNPIKILLNDKENEIRNKLKENNQVLVIKPHPRDKLFFSDVREDCNIRLLTNKFLVDNGLSLHNILGETSALLTDYSGIAFEYLLLNRPIGYVISDIDDYTRGFSVENPFDYMPGHKIRERKEFLQFLDSIKKGIDGYEVQRKELRYRLFGKEEADNGAKKIIQQFDEWEM